MKKTLFVTLLLPALALASCTFPLLNKKTVEKEIEVYDLDNIANNADISTGYQGKVKARFIEGEDYIPYLTLQDYASLYNPHFLSSVDSEFEEVDGDLVWSVKAGKQYYFIADFDMSYRAAAIAGSLSSAYREDDNQQDLEALNYAMQANYEAEQQGNNYATYLFSTIDCFKYDNEWYFPLGFLDILFCGDTDIYYYYNYAHIFSTKDVENYASVSFKEGTASYTVDSQMKANKKDSSMPEYLRKHNAALFMLLMNSFYGLKSYHNIGSMTKFYKDAGIYNNLLSSKTSVRAQAYADALDVFDDNHTALVSANDTWGEDSFVRRRLSKGIYARNVLRETLNNTRNAYYGGLGAQPGNSIVYSQDGKTAMYMFDSFIFTTSDVLNGDDLNKLYAEDTFLNIVHVLELIKNKSGVENVILDISTNGGGTIGVMVKLLALISKNNQTKATYYDTSTQQIVSLSCKVDTNQDGEYNSSDCFGNDFNFYILTSDCSFSCGNAFPCIAQQTKIAKIIGQKSGGGECAVGIHYLPNSQYVYHSSNLHLGYYDTNNSKFIGFESGATPDIEIKNTSDFYDIEKLNSMIVGA